MKALLREFEEFINQGNVMDLAVGVIIGGAFTAIVSALTDSIINPLISMIGGSPDVKGMAITFNGATVDFGAFISAVLNFLIIAVVVFFLVKAVNQAERAGKKLAGQAQDVQEEAPTCPFCLDEVNPGATKCCHCGSELPAPAVATAKEDDPSQDTEGAKAAAIAAAAEG